MAYARKLIVAKLAASLLVLGLLIAPPCSIRCAAHACTSPPSTENATQTCHHQIASHPVAGFAAQSCSDSCNPLELALEVPRIQVQLASSPADHSTISGHSAVLLLTAAASDTLTATPPGWSALSLPPASFDHHLSAPLRL